MSLRTADPAYYRALCYLPWERRRLARAGSGPHRSTARRVPLRRPQRPGFTRAAVYEAMLLALPGLTSQRVKIVESPLGPGTVNVMIDGALPREIEAARVALAPLVPPWCLLTVSSAAP